MVKDISIKRLNELISDSDFQKLNYNYEKTNLFDIIGKSHLEEWHSSFICWLLDPNASHGLGNFPIIQFFSLYYEKQEKYPDAERISPKELFGDYFDDLSLVTERIVSVETKGVKKGNGRIDIFGKNERFVLVIENKVSSTEQFRTNENYEYVGQTTIYYDYISKKYPDHNKFCVFLRPQSSADPKNAEVASDNHYININYQELFDYVIDKCLKHPMIAEEARIMIDNYANNLRNILPKINAPMAYTNKEVCYSLYAKYKDVFELIKNEMGRADRDRDSYICRMYEKYKHLLNEILISVNQTEIFINNGKKPEGIEFVKYLCEKGKIIPNSDMGEFYLDRKECLYEVDVKYEDGRYYLESGSLDGEGFIAGEFKSFGSAIQEAVNYYKRNIIKDPNWKSAAINGLKELKNKDGKSPNDLYYEIN